MKFGPLLLAGLTLAAAGCATHRGNVAALAQRQQTYFVDLQQLLATNRVRLEQGLALQFSSDAVRQANLLEWERDLLRADILLQVDADTRGNQQLLLTKLAEADLADHERWAAAQRIDRTRLQALLRLYDAVVQAVQAVRNNNQALLDYLGSRDEQFALRSLDVSALARAVDELRDLRSQLQAAEQRSAEQQAKDYEALDQKIEAARHALLQGLNKLPGK